MIRRKSTFGTKCENVKGITHLGVDELDTKDVGQEEDSLVLGVIDGWHCDVGLDAIDDLDLACDEKDMRSSDLNVRF